ncbi:MAG: AAA family ATPase [Anaerolineales bacterium]|nr:AAA family ATPase [Anaerolineales bacterium]
MKLIVFSGLPGSGKSTLAEAVGRELGIPVFAKDWLEAVLLRSELIQGNPDKPLGAAGYELLTTLAKRQLSLNQSVILDSVAPSESIREMWRDLTIQYDGEWNVVECICSDVSLHRKRLEERQRDIPGWHELKWSDVDRVKSYYGLWNEPRLILDAVNSFEKNFLSAIEYCS